MEENYPCPVCGGTSWESLIERTYEKNRIPKLKPHLQERYQILFDAWFCGLEKVKIRSVLCTRCGFLSYIPRPTELDIDKKYCIDVSYRKQEQEVKDEDWDTRKRSAGLYKALYKHIRPGSEILDYGGDRGQLVLPFVREGHHCYVIDYMQDTVPGVTHLSTKIDEVDGNRMFDVIILNHVLEHVADPRRLLTDLRNHHVVAGILYIEVPMELWGRIPPTSEPVTHVNFFTPPVLERLLISSGYSPIMCDLKWHHTRKNKFVVRAIAYRTDSKASSFPNSSRPVEYARSMMRSSPAVLLRSVKDDRIRALYIILIELAKRVRRSLRKKVRKSH